MDAELIALLLAVALAAGWVDAVVGGGGLVQLPILLLTLPTAAPAAVLATDKLSSLSGTTAAAVGFARRTRIDWRLAAPLGAAAMLLSGAGACAASRIPAGFYRPFVLAVLVVVALVVLLRPDLGKEHAPTRTRRKVAITAAVAGTALPFYNGLVGPGTGAMILITLTGLLGLDFVAGSAMAKVVNLGANLGALVVFAAQGHVFWALGLGMAACNVVGARMGTRTALRRGTGFIRATLLCVIAALILKLGLELWTR